MEVRELKENALVEHPEWGVGKIIRWEAGQVVLDFPSIPEQQISISRDLKTLKPLPPDGLAAQLYNQPAEVRSWVDNGQLRLVGAALLDLGGNGKRADILGQLEKSVPTGMKWGPWWEKVRKAITDSAYFKVGPASLITLSYPVADIPVEPLTPGTQPAGASQRKAAASRQPATELLQQQREVRETYATDLKLQRDAQAAGLAQIRKDYADTLAQIRKDYADTLAQIRKEYEAISEQQKKALKDVLEQQQYSHDADLARWNREEERLIAQRETLRAEMVSGRKKSNLEVRSGMLLHLGDIIQGTYFEGKSAETKLGEVMARLPMVLHDGDAELFGTVGDTVQYDPKFHHSPTKIAVGSPALLSAPGVMVSGDSSSGFVLLKATVTPKSEDSQ